MSIRTVIAHLTPLARQLRASILPGGGDPAYLFTAVLESGYLAAAADGTVDATELSALKSAVATLTEGEMSTEEIDAAIDDFIDLRSAEGEASRCRAVGTTLRAGDAGEDGLYLAAAIAYVSCGLCDAELAVLERIASAANLSGATLATIATSVRDELERKSAAE